MADKWEYKSVLLQDGNLEATLNLLGTESWELVSLTPAQIKDEGRFGYSAPVVVVGWIVPTYRGVLKRRKP